MIQASATFLFELIVIGLVLAFIYALMSIGITMVYGILRVVNFAHGEFYMIGGYTLYYFSTWLGIPSMLGLPLAAIMGFLIAVLVERVIVRDVYVKTVVRPVEYVLLGTFAISVLIQNFAIAAFGPFIQTPKAFAPGLVRIITFSVSLDRLIAMVSSGLMLLMLFLFFKKTWTGRIWMAVAQNRTGALALGIDANRVNMLSFGVSGALAAIAGAFLAPVVGVYPSVGVTPLLIGFVIIVIGGLGSIEGSVIGSLVVGLVQATVSALVSPAYGEVAVWLLLIIFLALRPSGLLGEKVRTV